eukprot:m.192039 g.192039  ORF g.192039 m.192039 type:complete len:107 (+) comp10053_c0_seq14:2274-2594(+)
MDFIEEAQLAILDVLAHVTTAHLLADQSRRERALIALQCLDGQAFTVSLSAQGYKIVEEQPAEIFDSLHGLLHNRNEAYVSAFYASLAARLNAPPSPTPEEAYGPA